jgi:glycosyltransferase involved in cell wall biosynthesis
MPPHPLISVALKPAPIRGLRVAAHYARFLAWCRREILKTRPDVVYCSDVRSYPIGLWASTRPGFFTILHEHDSPPTTGQVARLLLGVRRRFAQRATLCVIPQEERARRFRGDTGAERVRVVYNCPSLRELGEIECPPGMKVGRDGIVLWYHGSIGPGQLPPTTVEALARLPSDVRLEFAGYETVSSKGYVGQLMTRARNLGIAGRVSYHGPLPLRSDLLRTAAKADIGLALFATRFREPMVGASNKPFDYLACGLPLLTNRTTEWEGFFGAAGVSVSCDPEAPDDIARAVLRLRDDPEARHAMIARGQELIRSTWNYETQFAKVVEALEAGTLEPLMVEGRGPPTD